MQSPRHLRPTRMPRRPRRGLGAFSGSNARGPRHPRQPLTAVNRPWSCERMETTAELFEIEEHPRAGLIREMDHAMSALSRMKAKHGELFTQAQIATLTGLSRQRIGELIQLGAFQRLELKATDGEVLGIFVPGADVRDWLKSNPRPGRKVSMVKLVVGAADLS